ncbi:uncharacterized protein E0L32_001734 [Thyridium curvatum]|nr:uncharacterized protein E0L32_001734 [Thyridium curvatum]TPX08159.1 hypothetical protein E0L32_001734 [Thyridium curvatum]
MEPLSSMNSSMTSITTALPTPAHSVNGSSLPAETPHDVTMGDDSPQKRKRALDDLGDREQKKVHIEDRRLGIKDLHQDVGEKYLLCQTPLTPTFPNVSDDLYEVFNLTGIAAEVARTLPNGEKNAIRKTYKGHIKKLGVNGHFDSVRRELNDENGFMALIHWPEQEWNMRHVKGREIELGLSAETQASLRKAMTMAKGPIRKDVWDSSVLGDLSSEKLAAASKQSSSARPTAPNTPAHFSGAGVPRPKGQLPLGQDGRPRRSIKKRSYGDSSFEGYGEGFPDDDGGANSGYSTGEGEGAGQKRRKKVLTGLSDVARVFTDTPQNTGPAQFSTPPVRQQSYGPGMVGA